MRNPLSFVFALGLALGPLVSGAAFVHDMPPKTNEKPTDPSVRELEAGFDNPFGKVRTGCYWHWLAGNVSEEGVRKDLQAMKRGGIERAHLADVSQGDRPGQAPFLSPAWKKAMSAAFDEAAKQDVELGLFNCPGWSQSGGPWVTPDRAMRRFALSSTVLKAGERTKLPPPACGNLKEYRDYAVLAYPLRPEAAGELSADAPEKGRGPVELVSETPFTARSLVIQLKPACFAATAVLEVEQDGAWKKIATQSFERLLAMLSVGYELYADVVMTFPTVTAKRFRVRFENGRNQGGARRVLLRSAPGIDEVCKKTFAKMFEGHLPAWNEYMFAPEAVEEPGLAPAPTEAVVLTDRMAADGTLDWTPEKGTWTVYRIGVVPTRVKTQASAKIATGYETDKMSERHIRSHFDDYLGKLLALPGDKKAVKLAVMDSYEVGGQTYTDGFAELFQKTYGYDPTPYLPVFAGVAVGSREMSDRFLWDVRRLVADEIAYSYVGGLRRKCREHGMESWLENYGHRGFPGEFLKYGGQADAVGGEYWSEGPSGEIENRSAASCAHTYGKQLVWSESNTCRGKPYSRTPMLFKTRTDRYFIDGVNATMLHLYIHQPDERAPGFISWYGNEFNRHNSWFEHMDVFTGYLKRCNFMLRQGLNVADIAYYIGEDAPIMSGHADPAPPAGREYDFINAEVLGESAQVDAAGRIVLPHGTSYEILVLPDSPAMRPEMVRVLTRLVEAGAFVIGRKPTRSPSLADWPKADGEVKELADRLWGAVNGTTVKSAACGKGTIAWNLPLDEALRLRKRAADCLVPRGRPVAWSHRTMPNADIYFLCNRSGQPQSDVKVSFRVAGRLPEVWDAAGVSRYEATTWRSANGRTEVSLDFAPYESAFVVFARDAQGRTASAPAPKTRSEAIAGSWTMTFQSDALHRGPKDPVVIEKLFDLAKAEDDAVKHYSGKVVYRTKFTAHPRSASRLYLSLGDLSATAKIRLNGKPVGGVCFAPYRLDVTGKVRDGENELEIEVCTLWVNRLVGDAALKPEERPTWVSRGTYGTKSPLVKSGLLGPVSLVSFERP